MITAINDSGEVVGNYYANNQEYAFLDDNGTFTTLTDPLGSTTIANGINDAGQIVGSYLGNGWKGFLYESGTFTTIDDPLGTAGTYANGINNAGQIVGDYVMQATEEDEGFLYNGQVFATINDPLGTMGTEIEGINNAGELVGNYFGANGRETFVGNGGVFTTLNNPLVFNANGINDAGQAVGAIVTSQNQVLGYVATPINTPEPSTLTTAIIAFVVLSGWGSGG